MGRRPRRAIASVSLSLLVAGLLPGIASAQPGDGDSAVPQIVRLGVPVGGPVTFGIAGTGSYGYTEPIVDGDGDHHRVAGSLAASIRPVDFLSIWLRADGRYDRHPVDGIGQDDGLLGVPSLGVRLGGAVDPAFALGGELELSAPGSDAPSVVVDALTLEGRLLASLTLPEEGLYVVGMAGFRFDNSGAAVNRPVNLRRGDRIALGASDFHAILAGVGLSYRIDLVELLAEVTLNALVGDGAPDFPTSPLRADLGTRLHLTEVLSIEIGVEVVMSTRPSIERTDPLVPIEPRFTARAGLRIAIPLTGSTEEPEEEPTPEETIPEEPPEEVQPETGNVPGRVLDENASPVVGARVSLEREGSPPLEAITDETGSYTFEDVLVGPATLRIDADGYDPGERIVEVIAGFGASEDTALEPTTPQGQLRGMIRSYDGSPLEATIRINALDLEVRSDAEGFFELDVPPGDYRVVIEAPRHRTQRRRVGVPENGVTVLNADLRRGR